MHAWAVSRYADVDFILRNPRLFSSALWNTAASGDLVVVPEAPGLLRGRIAPSGARPSTGPEKRSVPRAGQRLDGAVASRWRGV
jgi:hypothetical protein